MKVPKLFKKNSVRYGLAGFAVAVIGYAGFLVVKPVVLEYQDSFAAKEFKQYGVWGTYHKHFFSFFDKVTNLSALEQENEELKERLAKLDALTTIQESDHAERDLASMNEKLEEKLTEETGSEQGLAPQVVNYELPSHLTGTQLHTLAIGYFRKQEYEKSAVIFQYLLGQKEDHQFERAENFLMNGISWFHLKDYKLAQTQILEAQKRSSASDPLHRKAMIWEAVLEKAKGNHAQAQNVLLHFVGQYPHAEESLELNGSRKPARFEAHPAVEHSVESAHEKKEESAKESKHEHEHEAVKGSEVAEKKETEDHEAK